MWGWAASNKINSKWNHKRNTDDILMFLKPRPLVHTAALMPLTGLYLLLQMRRRRGGEREVQRTVLRFMVVLNILLHIYNVFMLPAVKSLSMTDDRSCRNITLACLRSQITQKLCFWCVVWFYTCERLYKASWHKEFTAAWLCISKIVLYYSSVSH